MPWPAGTGDDTYVVDDAGDTVSEAVGAGTDLIESSIDFDLAIALEVENLTLLGAALNGTGNSLANLITGNGGNNTLIGAVGNDQLFGGAGLDTFIWNPGDGSDVIEGGTEADTLTFNGSAGAEIFAASANAPHLSFTRNVGNIVMDVNDVETLALNALGGADSVTVNDLAGTDVTTVNIDLGVNAARRWRRRYCHRRRDHSRGRHPGYLDWCHRAGQRPGRSGEHFKSGSGQRPPCHQRPRRQRHPLRGRLGGSDATHARRRHRQ